PGDRIAHTEYCSNYALIRAVTGLDPQNNSEAWSKFYELWHYDFIWTVNDGPVGFSRGRTTDMGHAEFLEGGIDRRDIGVCPFNSIEEVYEFDAFEEYQPPPMEELVPYYEEAYQNGQKANPGQVHPLGFYHTLVSGAIAAFGWEMFLAAAADWKRFDKVLEGFYHHSLHYFQAQAQTSAPVFLCHDDFVWTQGAFMHPDFYRHAIIPRYKKLWKVLKDAGKTVLFCSDGDFTQFVDDIIDAGADGLIFEPITNLEYVVERYGKTKCIVSSKLDCRTLTFGRPDEIRHEIDETLNLARNCPGFVFAVGNHIPSNVPVDNALYYFDYLSKNWWR
ncbi:MAG: hypothetical protein N3B12_08375, partial [Armatimonadetes bacterium]|nr:hypothetical protein [Armatimonadota bacterium]